ncbi:HD domain-containing protein [Roseomonas hellenica]|uniref:HD domain-containing protein n=1 Tax=Plastoroseomonas hellenica TaxID=2687306 RepID=A0ABS5EUN7_9PROT|nr:HD domain-containing protein [Plastoroseomonas hellenica]MBR0664007.1 HD domain-containing protein [Plastoroseomonas hellenica]
MMDSDAAAAEKAIGFLSIAERIKRELRHSWLSDGRRESVAEHTWFIALLALLTYRRLQEPVALERVLAMAIVHDIAEAEVGDIPFFEQSERKTRKAALELAAMDRISSLLPDPEGAFVRELWLEFEKGQTIEAKFVRALDHLEVQAQHNLADLNTWEPIEHELVYTKMDDRCAHDEFLQKLLLHVRGGAERKMKLAGIDVEAVKSRIAESR